MYKNTEDLTVDTRETKAGFDSIAQGAQGLLEIVEKLDQGISSALSKSSQAAAAANSVKASVRNMKKALAGFDELMILKMPSSSGGKSSSTKKQTVDITKYLSVLEEVLRIYGLLGPGLEGLTGTEDGLLGDLWEALFGTNGVPTGEVKISSLEKVLENIIKHAQNGKAPMDAAAGAAKELQRSCDGASISAGNTAQSAGQLSGPMEQIRQKMAALGVEMNDLSGNFDGVGGKSQSVVDRIKSSWSGISGWFKTNVANRIISGANGMLSGITNGINAVLDKLRNINITIPSWIPVFGGKTISFGSKRLSFPQIPYLASGAVLPANRPFLAVVGDQKHGTNVEAPLATIKQAVAEVLGAGTGGNITIEFTGDLAGLARVLQPEIYREGKRVGSDLIQRGVY